MILHTQSCVSFLFFFATPYVKYSHSRWLNIKNCESQQAAKNNSFSSKMAQLPTITLILIVALLRLIQSRTFTRLLLNRLQILRVVLETIIHTYVLGTLSSKATCGWIFFGIGNTGLALRIWRRLRRRRVNVRDWMRRRSATIRISVIVGSCAILDENELFLAACCDSQFFIFNHLECEYLT
jgi:hypothetical protein